MIFHSLGYDVPLLAQLPLEPELRETGEAGRPAVLNEDGALRADENGSASLLDEKARKVFGLNNVSLMQDNSHQPI